MRTYLLLPVLFFAFVQPSKAHMTVIPGCEDAKNTFALTECRANQIGEADAKLQEYLVAAKKQAVLFKLEPSAIESEQAAWETYRTKHCSNVSSVPTFFRGERADLARNPGLNPSRVA